MSSVVDASVEYCPYATETPASRMMLWLATGHLQRQYWANFPDLVCSTHVVPREADGCSLGSGYYRYVVKHPCDMIIANQSAQVVYDD